MKPTIARHCDNCHQYCQIEIIEKTSLICPRCQKNWGSVDQLNEIFDRCPICTCRQFYVTKDFNHFGGCLIMLIGIILVPFTYGLSLPVFALVDWLLYRKISTIIVCYRCGTEFKGFQENRFKPFMHHIGLKYDKYRK